MKIKITAKVVVSGDFHAAKDDVVEVDGKRLTEDLANSLVKGKKAIIVKKE